MFSEIVSIGTEILMGEIVDTNSGYLASKLPEMDIELKAVSVIGDDLESLSNTLIRALDSSDIIITTGGLGPTSDDLTREAISEVLKEKMIIDKLMLAHLKKVFKRRQLFMSSHNLKQATLIPSAKPIHNAIGTAPGWWVEKDGHIIIAMPGPPAEMKLMWLNEVAPMLLKLHKDSSIATLTIKTFGLPEATISEMIAPLFKSENPYLGIYARPDGVFLRAIAKAPNQLAAQMLLVPLQEEIESSLGPNIWGKDEDILEERISSILSERSETLSTMESFTGGALASAITDVTGSSKFFKGGIVTYTDEAKINHGVDKKLIEQYGAISPEVAENMAVAICEHMKTNAGIGTTGIAGSESVQGIAPGTTYIGIAYNGHTKVINGHFPSNRTLVKRRGVIQSLLELIRMLD